MRASEYSYARRNSGPKAGGTRTANYYHCRLKAIGRSGGRSAVACAAYRTGMEIEDERYGEVRDFTHKRDVVTHFTVAPENAPDWARDTAQLWNRVEAYEKRKDAQLAYEWEIALPSELSDAQRAAIAHHFASWLVEEYGVAVTMGVHSGADRGNGMNDHLHAMMTRRGVNADGFEPKILPQFSVKAGAKNPEVDRVREKVAELINDALEDAGSDERVDHRSFKARGIAQEPTQHLGPKATAMERAGIETELGDRNRAIVEERLRWQRDEAQPEIGARLPVNSAEPDADAASSSSAPMPAAASEAPRRITPLGYAWRVFSDRARAFEARLQESWEDHTTERERTALHRAKLAFDVARGIHAAIEGENPVTVRRGIEQGAQLARELMADEKHTGEPGGIWQAFVKAQRAVAEKARDFWENERGSVPGEDLAQAVWQAVRDAADDNAEAPRPSPPDAGAPAPDGSTEAKPDVTGPDLG